MTLPDWAAFCESCTASACEYKELLAAEDPEDTPFTSRYSAAEQQADLAAQCKQFLDRASSDEPTVPKTGVEGSTLLGRLLIRRGAALAETDLRQDAKAAFEEGLKCFTSTTPCQDILSQVNALNALGALLGAFGQLEEGLARLQEAEAAYSVARDDPAHLRGSQQLLHLEGEKGEKAQQLLEDAYTTTVYFLAQVHQNQHNTEEAVQYCAMTLQRQADILAVRAASQDASHRDWASNAAKLAQLFTGEREYAQAHHLLNAADCMFDQRENDGAHEEDDAELAADIAQSRGRLYLARLDASAEVKVGDKTAADVTSETSALPSFLAFPTLAIQPPSQLPWGHAALALTYEGARGLFNNCMPKLKAALDHFKLDGWVTGHIELLFDVSKAYSDLALFETDAHRACVMHRQRVKQFAKVTGDQLSYQHFEGLVKSIALEVASAARQLWVIKSENSWPAAKVTAANSEASAQLRTFIDLFRTENKLPDKVEEAWEPHVLTACVKCARLAVHRQGHALVNKQQLIEAEYLLKYASDYIARHKVDGCEEQGIMAAQMHELVAQQLQMVSQQQKS